MTTPRISVVITVYNGEAYLSDAVESVIEQTLADWELIVINDGSTDGSAAILEGFAHDRRVRLVHSHNRGRGAALNAGCELARAPLIAILDADDRCLPDRLAREVAHLEAHPTLGLVGSQALLQSAEGRGQVTRLPMTDTEIRRCIARRNPFIHSAVAYRKSLWARVGGYDRALPCALDLDFYIRAMAETRVENLSEALVVHRLHEGQHFRSLGPAVRERVSARRRLGAVRSLGLKRREALFPLALLAYSHLPPQVRALLEPLKRRYSTRAR